jgi:hypothetical protein
MVNIGTCIYTHNDEDLREEVTERRIKFHNKEIRNMYNLSDVISTSITAMNQG